MAISNTFATMPATTSVLWFVASARTTAFLRRIWIRVHAWYAVLTVTWSSRKTICNTANHHGQESCCADSALTKKKYYQRHYEHAWRTNQHGNVHAARTSICPPMTSADCVPLSMENSAGPAGMQVSPWRIILFWNELNNAESIRQTGSHFMRWTEGSF